MLFVTFSSHMQDAELAFHMPSYMPSEALSASFSTAIWVEDSVKSGLKIQGDRDLLLLHEALLVL